MRVCVCGVEDNTAMGTRLLLFFLFLGPAAMGLMVARCPEGWTARGGTNQCYLVHSNGRDRNFNDARTYCKARGGDLANIQTSELKNWLGQLVGATGDVGQNAYMWVGAKNKGGQWKWIETNTPVDVIVIEWEGTGSGECAAFTVDSTLIKQDCNQELKFICHRNIEIPMACDYTNGWDDSQDRCYKKSSMANSWHDSEVECAIEGGHLISIDGDAEQQLAHDLAIEEEDRVWIGYTEANHPGVFTWVDGSNSNETYWQEGQPDLSLNGFGAVVVDNDDPDGSWVVEKVTNEYHYLCEKPTGSCLPGWEEFEASCYYFNTEPEDLKVWQDAKSTCEAVKARMVVLDTEAEDLFLRTYMPESDMLWIGLYSKPGKDIYWTDGTLMSSKNFSHMSDEDRNSSLANKERQCAYLQEILDVDGATKTSSWVPSDCNTPRHYACEADAGAQLTLIPPSDKRYCPNGGWTQDGDFCYLFSFEEKTWTSARRDCQSKHNTADLVSVLTWAEQDFVFYRQLADGWIGLNQREEYGHWVWSDGTTTTITNWGTGEPDALMNNCVRMSSTSGKWYASSCSDQKAFACKMPASTNPIGTLTTTTPIPDTTACGIDWTENPSTGECYRIEVQAFSFTDARLHCQELDHDVGQPKPDLVSIYSAEEQTFVFNLLHAQHLSQSAVWIGMTDHTTGIKWSDGTPLAYLNFEDKEPDSYWMECIDMDTNTGKWNAVGYYERRPFICEKKGKNYVGPQPPSPPEVRCPNGWSYWDNNCYFFSSDTTDWFTAESNCQNMLNSHLASITNQDENDYITGILNTYMRDAWLGLRDNGNKWHWVDGSLYDWTNWEYDEPDLSNGENMCGKIMSWYYDNVNGKWSYSPCTGGPIHYVCKMNVRTCPQNWAYKSGKCYYVGDIEVSRNEGQIKCEEVNKKATLVNIHSDEENQIFMEELEQSSEACWLGLQYNHTNWTWADGTAMEYTNWNDGEPHNLDTDLCVEMINYPNGEPRGKWNSLDCGQSRAFGCELYPTHVIGCEEGWETFGDYCYWFSNSGKSDDVDYTEAQKQCQDKGANLASIHSSEENNFVFSFIGYEYKCTMIGFSDIGHHMLFTWEDGTSVVFTDVTGISYSNLGPDQLCACYHYSTEESWIIQDCKEPGTFVCKKPQEAIPLNTDTGCEEGDLYYEASCYNSPHVSSSWEDAKSDCDSRGQQLLVLENRFETAYMSSALGELDLKVWLGLSGTTASDGSVTFTWINGKPLDYTYWDKNEPDPEEGTCVAASGERSGFWGVQSCNDKFEYFCEYDRVGYTTPPPPTTKSPSYYCLYDWEHKGQRCYKVMENAAIWGDAEEKCILFGGHLASVKDETEQSIILALSGMDAVVNKSGSVWVGLVMNGDTGYVWTDGTGFDFVNWAPGQPDSQEGRELCVSADASTLKLSDRVCLTHLPFICEVPVGEMMTTATLPTKPPLHPCSDDPTWYNYEDHCYKFISITDEPGETWWRSHELCRKEGGELASITSKEENYWIESMIYDKAGQALWLGGRAMLGAGYEWVDDEPFIYDNWAPGEPNNVHDQEDCINMYTNNQGYWNDINCGQEAGRICKRQDGVTLPPPKTTEVPDGHCPEGWLHTGTKCIHFIMDKMNFTTARQVCQKIGSKTDLASVHSAAEQAYLTAAMVTVEQHMWLGMRYEFGFYWVDQTDVSYTNWGAGEPDGNTDEDECVEVSPETGMWSDISCSDNLGAVCMMTQDPNLPNHHTLDKCPSPHDNYLVYDGACYRAVNALQTWEKAEATCTGEDAHLVSIMTYFENSFVWAASQESGFGNIWTGLISKESLEEYEWSDGWPTVFTNWGENEPAFNPITRTCVVMNVTDGSWYTNICGQPHTFICKYTNETAPTPDPPSTGRCPDSRWKDLHGGYCYLFSNKTEKWSDANLICLHENSYLASVHSKEEMKLLTLTMQNYNEPFWIGLVETTNGESWTDGTSLNYVNWQKGEPNNHEDQCTEAIERTGYWNDVGCDVSRYYICKTRKIQEETDKPIMPPTTDTPGGGGDGGNGKPGLGGGGIAGIVIAVLFVVTVMGFVGYSYTQKHRKRADNTERTAITEDVFEVSGLDGSDA